MIKLPSIALFGGTSPDQGKFFDSSSVYHSLIPTTPAPGSRPLGGAGIFEVLLAMLRGNAKAGRNLLATQIYPTNASQALNPQKAKSPKVK